MGVLAPLGRLFFSALFLISGMNHFINYSSVVEGARGAGLPWPEVATLASGVALVVGGVCVLLGAFARLGAALLVLFLVTAALTVHDFWTYTDPQQSQQQLMNFLRNFSLAGGALLVMALGPGPYSLGRRRGPAEERGRLSLPMRQRHA